MLRPINFGDVLVGPGCKPLVLPDIDMFFNADLEVAETLIAGVKAAGLRVIKAAIITSADIAFDKGAQETYLDNDGIPVSVSYRQLLERKAMSRERHERLFDFIRRNDLQVVVSVYDMEGLEIALEQGCVGIKIASSNITHKPLIQAIARTGLPVLMDTGKSLLTEVERALSWLREVNPGCEVVVEHSPYAPPAPLELQNLNAISFLRERLALNVGLSHHARGTLMILGSIGLGPAVIEFGLCPDDTASDQDVFHAVSVGRLKSLVEEVDALHRALGGEQQFLARVPDANRGRMALRAGRDLLPGDRITLDNTAFSFPVLGIPVELWDEAHGRILRRPVQQGEPITFEDLA